MPDIENGHLKKFNVGTLGKIGTYFFFFQFEHLIAPNQTTNIVVKTHLRGVTYLPYLQVNMSGS